MHPILCCSPPWVMNPQPAKQPGIGDGLPGLSNPAILADSLSFAIMSCSWARCSWASFASSFVRTLEFTWPFIHNIAISALIIDVQCMMLLISTVRESGHGNPFLVLHILRISSLGLSFPLSFRPRRRIGNFAQLDHASWVRIPLFDNSFAHIHPRKYTTWVIFSRYS